MKGEHIHRVARPGQRFAVCRDLQATQARHPAPWRVRARQPLRVKQSQRPRRDGDHLAHLHDLAIQVGQLDLDSQGTEVGGVEGLGDGANCRCSGLRQCKLSSVQKDKRQQA